jgi:hypothetical protein
MLCQPLREAEPAAAAVGLLTGPRQPPLLLAGMKAKISEAHDITRHACMHVKSGASYIWHN